MSVLMRRLKEARIVADLSQERLGLLAGLEVESASARMNRYERGTRVPDYALLVRIGEVLNRPTAYFYAASDDEAALLSAFHRMTADQKAAILQRALAAISDEPCARPASS